MLSFGEHENTTLPSLDLPVSIILFEILWHAERGRGVPLYSSMATGLLLREWGKIW